MDLTKNESYQIVSDLLNEFVPFFPGPFFHLGTDEYFTSSDYPFLPQYYTYAQQHIALNATPQDLYLYFINWANSIVNSYKKKSWVWDDNEKSWFSHSIKL